MPNLDLSLIEDFFFVVSKMMVMSDGREHRCRRQLASYGLNDALIDSYAAKLPAIIESLFQESIKDGKLDFAKDVASRLPSIVLADLFCIPEEDREKFYQWSNDMTGFFGGGSGYENEDGVRVNHAALSLRNYFKDLLESRKAEKVKDFFSGMLAMADRLDVDENDLISQAIMMLVAGQVTTSDQMNNILFQLIVNQDLLKQVQNDSRETSGNDRGT